MENVIKLLSKEKDYRLAAVDTTDLTDQLLQSFPGTEEGKNFLKKIMTNCILIVALDNIEKKYSFSFRLAKGITIFFKCTIRRFLCIIPNS